MSRDSGYNGGDGSASQTTTPVSVFNPPKSTTPTVSAPKEYDYTQTTKIDTSLSDSYFGEQLNSSWGDKDGSKDKGGVWSGVKSWTKATINGLKNPKTWGKGFRTDAKILDAAAASTISIPEASVALLGYSTLLEAIAEEIDPSPIEKVTKGAAFDLATDFFPESFYKDAAVEIAKEALGY